MRFQQENKGSNRWVSFGLRKRVVAFRYIHIYVYILYIYIYIYYVYRVKAYMHVLFYHVAHIGADSTAYIVNLM